MTLTNEEYHADPAISASHLKASHATVALPLLEPVPKPKTPHHGAYRCNAAGQPCALRSAGAR
jgi:hypothetical protein